MRILLSAILVAMMLMVPGARGQAPAPPKLPAETAAQKEARLAWWTDARFGMFIHWGLYALAARHEWVKNNEQIPDDAYEKYFERLRPRPLRPTRVGRGRQAGRHEVLRHHHQAPRGLLPVGLQVHRLQGDRTPLRNGPAQADGRGVPGRGPARRASTTR